MLVAKAFDEEIIYRAAAAFESRVDWKSLKAGLSSGSAWRLAHLR
jgi:Asp-tRNA(Asn)/Glu-tRNA(Gln) amidotransferase A subunit family amidase